MQEGSQSPVRGPVRIMRACRLARRTTEEEWERKGKRRGTNSTSCCSGPLVPPVRANSRPPGADNRSDSRTRMACDEQVRSSRSRRAVQSVVASWPTWPPPASWLISSGTTGSSADAATDMTSSEGSVRPEWMRGKSWASRSRSTEAPRTARRYLRPSRPP